jgi:hypothetical protein
MDRAALPRFALWRALELMTAFLIGGGLPWVMRRTDPAEQLRI